MLRVSPFMRMPMKTSLALAILALIAAAALLGSPWMNQRFHMPAEKTQAQQRETAGSTREPAVSNHH
ncbi:hypothetical protein QFZ86_002413 [Pseudomonas plecoglossicida]